MQKFRKRPVVIDAVRLMEPAIPTDIISFCPTAKLCGVGDVGAKMWMEIPTLEGVHRADYGDWIIKGVAGEFYPCKPEIFAKTYEPV